MPKQDNFRPIEVDPDKDLLTTQELAFCLRVSDRYVYGMRAAGFQMPAGTATLSEARTWIIEKNYRCGPSKIKLMKTER